MRDLIHASAKPRHLQAIPQAQMVDEIRAVVGNGHPGAIPALCKVLAEQWCDEDIETIIHAIEALYRAEAEAFAGASRRLGKAAQDACDDYGIEMP